MVLTKPRALLSLAACAVVARLGMHEAGRTIADLSVGGVTHSTRVLSSILHVSDAGTTMHTWAVASCAEINVKAWLLWYVVFGLAFVVSYTSFALGANARWRLRSKGWIRAVVVFHGLQLVVTLIAVLSLPSRGTCAAHYRVHVVFPLLIAATSARWLVSIGLVAHVVWVVANTSATRESLRLTMKACATQRFQLVVVTVLATLFLLPGAPILEQGIDVERSWIIDVHRIRGVYSAVWAALAFGLLAIALRYLSSVQVAPTYVHPPGTELQAEADELEPQVVKDYRNHSGTITRVGKIIWWAKAFGASLAQSRKWFTVSAIAVVSIWLLGLTPIMRVYWRSAMWIAIVLASIPLLSAALALVRSPVPREHPGHDLRARALQVGRGLSLSVPVILLLSLCRSLFAPLMLLHAERFRCAIAILVSVAAACGLIWWILARPTPAPRESTPKASKWNAIDPQLAGARKGTPTSSPPRGSAPPARVPGVPTSIAIPMSMAVLCFVALMLVPVHVSRLLGVVGTVGICFVLLTSFYTTLRIVAQLIDPPHLFRLLTLRRAPVVEIVLAIVLLSTVFARGSDFHAIRQPSQTLKDQRPDLATAFASWSGRQTPDCAITVTTSDLRELHVRPLVIVAAEGGGMRAAWWTVDAMTVLTSTSCGRNSVFLASGVSGGAVGLGVMATTKDAYSHLADMAGQDALAVGTEGLMSRDLVTGSFGINVSPVDGPHGDDFPDRAALMEQAWERRIPEFSAAFPSAAGATSVPWRTVFNGTSVANKCRVLIADVKLITTTAANCAAPGNEIPGAYDLFAAQDCNVGLRTSTASLLAARFPYVTPSGIIVACGTTTFKDQVIDGGYSENTGIDTANSTLEQLMPAIRRANATALSAAGPATVIVPMVMFLHNTVVASSSGAPSSPKPVPELIVPPTNLGDRSTLGDPTTLLQRAAVVSAEWIPDTSATESKNLHDAVAPVLPQLAMTIAPQQEPQIALPLGWTMSRGTQGTLDKALDAYLRCTPSGERTCAQSKAFDQLMTTWKTKMSFPQ